MIRNCRAFFHAVVLLLMVGLLSGCVGAMLVGGAAGVGGVFYVKGQLKKVYSASFVRVYRGSIAATEAMEWNITKEHRDAADGKIEAKKGDGGKVTIKVKRLSDTAAEVQIRIGSFGDKRLSEMFIEKLDAQIK